MRRGWQPSREHDHAGAAGGVVESTDPRGSAPGTPDTASESRGKNAGRVVSPHGVPGGEPDLRTHVKDAFGAAARSAVADPCRRSGGLAG